MCIGMWLYVCIVLHVCVCCVACVLCCVVCVCCMSVCVCVCVCYCSDCSYEVLLKPMEAMLIEIDAAAHWVEQPIARH